MQNELFGEKEGPAISAPGLPRVLNKYRDGVPVGAVYIGRPSKWGNPFAIGKDGSRAEVIEKYRRWLDTQPALVAAAKKDLVGKDLVCFCSPSPCHGDVLVRVANEAPPVTDSSQLTKKPPSESLAVLG